MKRLRRLSLHAFVTAAASQQVDLLPKQERWKYLRECTMSTIYDSNLWLHRTKTT